MPKSAVSVAWVRSLAARGMANPKAKRRWLAKQDNSSLTSNQYLTGKAKDILEDATYQAKMTRKYKGKLPRGRRAEVERDLKKAKNLMAKRKALSDEYVKAFRPRMEMRLEQLPRTR